MEEIMDQLQQILEERVHDLLSRREDRSKENGYRKSKEHVTRVEQIMSHLSGEDRNWLEDLLLSNRVMEEEDARKLYMAGFRDAFKMMKLLGV